MASKVLSDIGVKNNMLSLWLTLHFKGIAIYFIFRDKDVRRSLLPYFVNDYPDKFSDDEILTAVENNFIKPDVLFNLVKKRRSLLFMPPVLSFLNSYGLLEELFKDKKVVKMLSDERFRDTLYTAGVLSLVINKYPYAFIDSEVIRAVREKLIRDDILLELVKKRLSLLDDDSIVRYLASSGLIFRLFEDKSFVNSLNNVRLERIVKFADDNRLILESLDPIYVFSKVKQFGLELKADTVDFLIGRVDRRDLLDLARFLHVSNVVPFVRRMFEEYGFGWFDRFKRVALDADPNVAILVSAVRKDTHSLGLMAKIRSKHGNSLLVNVRSFAEHVLEGVSLSKRTVSDILRRYPTTASWLVHSFPSIVVEHLDKLLRLGLIDMYDSFLSAGGEISIDTLGAIYVLLRKNEISFEFARKLILRRPRPFDTVHIEEAKSLDELLDAIKKTIHGE